MFAADARRFLVAHAVLRELLEEQGVVAACDPFQIGIHGKPYSPRSPARTFNMSHSGNRALIGIGGSDEVGVDVELLHRLDDMPELAALHFSEAERQSMRRLGGAAAERAFLTVWTRKEACLKAIGSGLTIAPETFHVGLETSQQEVVIPRPGGDATVSVASLDLGPDVVAAVAVAAGR